MDKSLYELAQILNAILVAPEDQQQTRVCAVGPIDSARADHITFSEADRPTGDLRACNAAAVLVVKQITDLNMPQLVVDDMDRAVIEVLTLFAPVVRPAEAGVHATALIAEGVELGPQVSIGPGVIIDSGVKIGANSVIMAGCVIGESVCIGENTRLESHVVVYHHCNIGNHVVVQANTTIGSVGFGYSHIDGQHRLIPHNGGVLIEDFVEIGANCCIDRAKFTNTIVGSGTKMDNLVQVGHNVIIGKCCLICAQVGIAGSTVIGNGVVLGGQVGLADNITVGDGAMIGAKSGVMSPVPAGQKMLWSPALQQKDALRILGELMRLPKTAKQVKQLTKRLERFENTEDDKG